MKRAAARHSKASGRHTLALALGAGSVAALVSGALSAHDANRVQSFMVGPSAALATCEGLNSSNDGRARASFPRAAELRVRTRVPGGIGQAPASDESGNLILAHGEPRLSKLDARGRSLWSERLPSEASCTPTLLSDGSILVITRDADALLFQPTGKALHKRALAFADPRRRTFSIPTSNGGAFVASGADLLELDARGELTRQTRARGTVTGIAESAFGLLAITDNGSVQLGRATGDFELLGSLGGSVAEGAAVQAGKLLAVVDAHKLVALDLKTGQARILASESALSLTGPPVLFEAQTLALVVDGGFVSLRNREGAESVRASLTGVGQAFDPATRNLRPALVIGDRTGAVAATQSGSEALLLGADGSTQRFEDSACLDPFRPTPLPGGVAFSCRSGQLFIVNDKAQ